jgi:RNA polymerase sigma-70 factor (ECF subfamily)
MKDETFGQMLWESRPQLIAYAIKLCRDQEKAEDLASEVIVRGWQFREKFQPQNANSLIAWLGTILYNLYITHHRRKKWDGGYLEDIKVPLQITPPSQEAYIHLKEVEGLLDELPKQMRKAVTYSAFHGNYAETAKAMGVCLGTAKSRIGRGRKALKELWDGK